MVMRTDLTLGYALTALFMVSMLIIGAELLFDTGTSISDEEGLLALVDPMQYRFGLLARWAFLIGFWAVATGAMLGAWNGGAHLFADCVRTIREVPDEEASDYLSVRSIYFRGFLAWMSVPAPDPAGLRRAGPAGDRLRLPRCSLPALFGDCAAHTPELPACDPRVPQQARLQCGPRRLGDPLHRRRCAGGAGSL
jgi:hypothetical protein